jgi:hypothetical protein
MKLNETIIFRRDGEGALLYNPEDGTLTRVNATGVFIWRCLGAGLGEDEIVSKFESALGDKAPADLRGEVQKFLGMLAGKGFLFGFSGESVEMPMVSLDATSSSIGSASRPLYELRSIQRVFVPGDALVLEERAFESFVPGDIVAFYPKGRGEAGIVHRMIGRDTNGLITMGENNDSQDSHRVTEDDEPHLVVARIRPDGVRLDTRNGRSGMRQFRWNRFRRCVRCFGARLVNPLLPLMFWRCVPEESVAIGDGVQYYHNRKLIAVRSPAGVEFIPIWNKFRFRIDD